MKPVEQLLHPTLRDLQPYSPGEQPEGSGWVKLNTNELPFPPPEAVTRAIAAESQRLARYPHPRSQALRQALADHHGLKAEQVIVGNGSDDVINLLARAFGGTQSTAQTFPSYSLYPVVTAIAGGTIRSVPFEADFRLPVDALLATRPNLLFLTRPNAPTGVAFPLSEVEELAHGLDGLLVVDEAYVEFSRTSCLGLLPSLPNLVLTRTFSKAWGLAGLRVGYALGCPEVVEILDRIRDSYNVNRLSQAGALAALGQRQWYGERVEQIRQTRDWVRQALLQLNWQVYPSEANFLFGRPVHPQDPSGSPACASGLFAFLRDRRILVRYFPGHPLTASGVRISIGTDLEMETFMEGVEAWNRSALAK